MHLSYEVLINLPLFESIDFEGAQHATSMLKSKHFKSEEIIIKQGEWQGELHIVKSGLVSVTMTDAQGSSIELGRLGKGECFGEMSLITGQLPSTTVTAIADTDTWVLSQQDFMTLIGRCPVLSQNISRILSERLSYIDGKYVAEHLAETIVLYDLQPGVKGSVLCLNIGVSLARQTRGKVLFVELAQDSDYVTPCLPEFGCLVDIFEDKALLNRHKAPIDRDNGLCGLRVVRLTSPQQANNLQPEDALAILALLEPIYDYILIRSPLGTESLSRNILERANLVFVLLYYQELSGAHMRLDFLQTLSNAAQKVGLLITSAPAGIAVSTAQSLGAELRWRIERTLPEDAALMHLPGGSPFVLVHANAPLTQEIDRLSRRIAKISVGLALGAGGAKGLAHLGVLKVLEEGGVPIDYVAGCSFGAFIGALYAIGYDSTQLSKIVLEILTPAAVTSFFRSSFLSLSLSSLLGGKKMEKGLREVFGETEFKDLNIPFAAVAVDLNTGSEIVLKEGKVYLAVRASTSMPGIFPPLRSGDLYLVDGGVLNPLPTGTVIDLGANVIIGVDVSNPVPLSEWPGEHSKVRKEKQPGLSRHVIGILHRAVDIMQTDMSQRGSEKAGILIRPKFGPCSWHDFHRREQFVTAGEQAAKEALPQLGTLLPWLAA